MRLASVPTRFEVGQHDWADRLYSIFSVFQCSAPKARLETSGFPAHPIPACCPKAPEQVHK